MRPHSRNEYTPDSVSSPGETLAAVLEALGMTQADLAERTGRPKKTINEIIKAKAVITSETAVQFERALGIEASFWIAREATYRAHLAKQEEERHLQRFLEWPKQFPVQQLRKYGWISESATGIALVRELLSFFGISTPESFNAVYQTQHYQFRTAKKFEIDSCALAAWLRRGEIEAIEADCEPYDKQGFLRALQQARELTKLATDDFRPRLQELCAAVGVVVAFVPELPKTRVNGATRWISPTKALVQLSYRYKRNDILWFTFFHESGHIVLHGRKDVFVETGDPSDSQKEKEADDFAASTLLPRDKLQAFLNRANFSRSAVTAFAQTVDVHPAIVVGRLRHDGLIQQHVHADLIAPLRWPGQG